MREASSWCATDHSAEQALESHMGAFHLGCGLGERTADIQQAADIAAAQRFAQWRDD